MKNIINTINTIEEENNKEFYLLEQKTEDLSYKGFVQIYESVQDSVIFRRMESDLITVEIESTYKYGLEELKVLFVNNRTYVQYEEYEEAISSLDFEINDIHISDLDLAFGYEFIKEELINRTKNKHFINEHLKYNGFLCICLEDKGSEDGDYNMAFISYKGGKYYFQSGYHYSESRSTFLDAGREYYEKQEMEDLIEKVIRFFS